MIQVVTIICQALAICAMAVNFYYLRQLEKERRRTDELRAAYPAPHTR